MKTLILGGVKSGKSRYAENRLKALIAQDEISKSRVAVIVTAQALDDSMAKRIEKHQQQRPTDWFVKEAPIALAESIQACEASSDIIMVDCLTLWLTNLLMLDNPQILQQEIACFLDTVKNCQARLVVVSNETNMGIMPLGQLTRDYCDQIGVLHQQIAEISDEVVLIVAGLPLFLKSPNTDQVQP